MTITTSRQIAIIGAGPNGVYALDILLRALQDTVIGTHLTVKIFEASGEYGSGSTHSIKTPEIATLNRTAGQVALGAGKFYKPDSLKKFSNYSSSFLEWAAKKYDETNDARYKFIQSDWPPRGVFGEAMVDAFSFCYTKLNAIEGVTIELISEEVLDIHNQESSEELTILTSENTYIDVERVLVITGNIERSIDEDSWMGTLSRQCKETECLLVENPLPMQTNLDQLFDFNEVFLVGTGTTAIDVINYILCSGAQKSEKNITIFPISRNGLFCYSRAINQKIIELDDFHKGYIFNFEMVDLIRARVQKLYATRQLNFEIDILPILLAEMSIKYYATMFGPSFEEQTVFLLKEKMSEYLSGAKKFETIDDAEIFFADDIRQAGEKALLDIQHFLLNGNWNALPINQDYFEQYARTTCPSLAFLTLTPGVIATVADKLATYDDNSLFYPDPIDNKFDWMKMFNPIDKGAVENIVDYKEKLLSFMKRDVEQSKQGNIDNPTKAAFDGVWRDLRDAIIYSIEKGGVTGPSYMKFIDYYLPLHNRISDGPGIATIENIIGKIELGQINLEYIYGSKFTQSDDNSTMEIIGSFSKKKVDCIVLGTLDMFKKSYKNNILYKNLQESKMVHIWCEKQENQTMMGLNINDKYHPIQQNGQADERLTFLGPSCEGYHLFQHTLSRPDKKQPTITNLVSWLEEFL